MKISDMVAPETLRLASSSGEDSVAKLTRILDALPYCDEPPTQEESRIVNAMIEQEMRQMATKPEDYLRLTADDVAASRPESLRGCLEDAIGLDGISVHPSDSIEKHMYWLTKAKVALEYETARNLELQLLLKYGALCQRAHNEGKASLLARLEDELRVVLGDTTHINRERKAMQCGEVRDELARLEKEYKDSVVLCARLHKALE
jgi:hypothetical protein